MSILPRLWHGTCYFYRRTRCPQCTASQEAYLLFHLLLVPCGKQLCGLQPAGRVLPAARLRHRVKAPFAEGIAPGDAPCPQQDALYAPMGHDGLHGVVAAAGRKTAAAADPWAESVLVGPDGHAQRAAADVLQAVHASGFSACALRAGGTVAGGGASGRLALSGRPACANSFATTLLSCQLFSRGVIPRATKIRS